MLVDVLSFASNPVFISIYALAIGSFLSVCIYRIPYGRPKGLASLEVDEEQIEKDLAESKDKINIFFPRRSFCPSCKQELRWWHNIPLLSWLFMRGRCAYCKARISFRYPAVELLSLVFALLSYYSFSGWTALIVYLFCCSLIVIVFVDIDYYIIPNSITFPGMFLGLLFAVLNHFFQFFEYPLAPNITMSLYGLLAGGGFLFFISEVYFRLRNKVGLGFGDVKLMAMVGLLFGPWICLQAIFLGSLAGSVIGILQIICCKKSLQHALPFGPYLAIGTVLALFLGNEFSGFLA